MTAALTLVCTLGDHDAKDFSPAELERALKGNPARCRQCLLRQRSEERKEQGTKKSEIAIGANLCYICRSRRSKVYNGRAFFCGTCDRLLQSAEDDPAVLARAAAACVRSSTIARTLDDIASVLDGRVLSDGTKVMP